MKKTVTSLLLVLVMLFSLAMTSCSFNYKKSSAYVTIDLDGLLKGQTITAEAYTVATTADAKHDFLAALAAAKENRKTDEKVQNKDVLTIHVDGTQKGDDDKDTNVYDNDSLEIDLNKAETDYKNVELVIYKKIVELMGTEEGAKVGTEYTTTAKMKAATVDKKQTLTLDETNGADTTLKLTISVAKMPMTDLTLGENDLFTIYYTKLSDGKTSTEKNWSYDFSKNTLSGGVSFDPYYENDAVSSALHAALVGKQLVSASKLADSEHVVLKHDLVKVTLTAKYTKTDDAATEVSVKDIGKDAYILDMASIPLEDVKQWIYNDIKDGERKVGSSYTITKQMYIDESGNAFNSSTKTLYKADDEGVTLTSEEVSIEYKVASAYTAEWNTVTVTEGEGEDRKEVTYDYYISGVKTPEEKVTLEKLADSSLANNASDKNGNKLYLYLYKSESKDGDTVTETKYYNNYYGKELFTLKDGVYTDKDGNTLGTEEDAVVDYAVAQYLSLYEEATKKQNAITAMWKLFAANATVDVPQSLKDDYYKEYYQNQRYTFYVTNSGSVKDGDNTYTDFEEWLQHTTKAESKDKIREAVDAMAIDALKPRLIIYTIAEKLGVSITKEDMKTIEANLEAQVNQNNAQYYTYLMQYGESIVNYLNLKWYNSVDDYVKDTYGNMENVKVGVLFDKVMEELYDDTSDQYHISFEYKNEEK